jgi:hypothetical protein
MRAKTHGRQSTKKKGGGLTRKGTAKWAIWTPEKASWVESDVQGGPTGSEKYLI